ncbi:MAG TPA: class I SAM-dependent methyltransferase [Pyrinomonadaceae bacterium]|nr:class I SAM-dependent methyltransferase [Pyrinomonadaceae bacterium]
MDSTETKTPDAPAAQHDGPTPERIFQALTAYQLTAAVKAAVELDIFTAVSEGATDAGSLAARSGASERGVRILCDYLTVTGFLTKSGGRYGLAPDTELFLVRTSPAYIGGMSGFLTGPELTGAFQRLTESVRKGGTVLEGRGSMSPEHPMWEEFARGMASLQGPMAEFVARTAGVADMESCKVLDIAASHGVFGITLARHNSRAEIHALDWANVLPFARENARAAGVAERFHEIPGDAFEVDFGEGYDLVLLMNFFHHFDPPTCERLMRKVHAALAPGGRAVTQEFVPSEDRVSPPVAATFPLVMLASTEAGDAYTFSEFERMFRNAGFSRSELREGPPPGQVIVSWK